MNFGLKSAESLFLVLAFIAPGFVIISVRNYFVIRRPLATTERALAYLTASALNYALFSPLIYLLIVSRHAPLMQAVGWFVVLFLGPTIVGLVWAIASQGDWIRTILRRLGMRPVHVIPTAWDWKFANIKDPVFPLITLKNGEQFGGLFGYQSFASSTSDRRDIFLEQLYDVLEDEEWAEAQPGKGVLIDYTEIAYIEFMGGNQQSE